MANTDTEGLLVRITTRCSRAAVGTIQLSRAATMSYLAIALTSFWINGEQAAKLGRPSGLAILFGSFVLMTVVGAMLGHVWDVTAPYVSEILDWGHRPPVEEATTLSVRSGMRTITIPIFVLILASAAASAVLLFAARGLAGSSLSHAVVTLALFTLTLAATCVAAGMLDPSISRYLSSSASSAASGCGGVMAGGPGIHRCQSGSRL